MKTPKRKPFSKKIRQQILEKFGGYCAYCGCLLSLETMQIDHLFPVKKGGTDEPRNLMPACRSCNHYKESFTLEQFRDRIGKTTTAFRKSPLYRLAMRYGIIMPCGTWDKQFHFEKTSHENT